MLRGDFPDNYGFNGPIWAGDVRTGCGLYRCRHRYRRFNGPIWAGDVRTVSEPVVVEAPVAGFNGPIWAGDVRTRACTPRCDSTSVVSMAPSGPVTCALVRIRTGAVQLLAFQWPHLGR